MGELDIDLTTSMDDDLPPDPEADALLSSMFSGPVAAEDEETSKKEASQQKKAGIKKLGGQPKVASTQGAGVDISSIWQSAPDVSEVFR